MWRAVLGMWTAGCSAGDAREGPGKEIWAGERTRLFRVKGRLKPREKSQPSEGGRGNRRG